MSSDKVGGIYVDGSFAVLPYTVGAGEKKLIIQRHPPGFRYMVLGTDWGGYVKNANGPFSPKIEIEADKEVDMGPLRLTGKKVGS